MPRPVTPPTPAAPEPAPAPAVDRVARSGRPDPVAKVAAPGPEAGRRPGRFVAAALVAALLCSAGVLAVNYAVDPRNAFPPDHYRPLWKDTYDDRLRQWERMEPAPGVVVFGSSTSLRLDAEDVANLTGLRAFNFAAPGSGPEDYLPVFDYMVRTGRAPREVIVGLDDFLLLDVYWNRAILPSSNAYARVADEPVPFSYIAEELGASFNPGYTLDSLRVLWYTHAAGYPEARATGVQPDRAEGLAELLGPGVRGIFEGQYSPETKFSGAKEDALHDLVAHAAAANVTLRLLLPPIHPDVLALFEDSPEYARIHGRAVAFAQEACASGARAHDLVRLDSFGGDPAAFENAWHYSRENGHRMLEAAYGTPGSCTP
ncbi:MAG: hypothetical protein ACYC2H_06270 [Thermoplasmatota archaeon]